MATQQQKEQQAYERGLAHAKTMVADPTAPSSIQYQADNARCLAELIGWPTEKVVAEVRAYHRERMEAVPDLTVYPELRGYRDMLDAEERGYREGGIDDATIALMKTLGFWRDTRLLAQTGRAYFVLPTPEKCRVVYVPASDVGAIRAKNVDDPMTYFKPYPPTPDGTPWPFPHPLMFDGVGSGLHIDEVPVEIFPVNPHELCKEYCTTVPDATEFMVRYNEFWAGQNLIIHDYHGNSMAFEKTRRRVAVRKPNVQGISFITGMGALDPGIRQFQREQRQKFLDQQGWTWDDSPDGRFFQLSERTWDRLAQHVDELSMNPSFDNLKQVMEQRDPECPMCLTGAKNHPTETVTGYTLIMDIWNLDRKTLHRRQWRGDVPVFLDTPEIVQFS